MQSMAGYDQSRCHKQDIQKIYALAIALRNIALRINEARCIAHHKTYHKASTNIASCNCKNIALERCKAWLVTADYEAWSRAEYARAYTNVALRIEDSLPRAAYYEEWPITA